jgi:hypothetical protein
LFLNFSHAHATPDNRSPRAKALWEKWRHVWMMAWERDRRLKDKLNYLQVRRPVLKLAPLFQKATTLISLERFNS